MDQKSCLIVCWPHGVREKHVYMYWGEAGEGEAELPLMRRGQEKGGAWMLLNSACGSMFQWLINLGE